MSKGRIDTVTHHASNPEVQAAIQRGRETSDHLDVLGESPPMTYRVCRADGSTWMHVCYRAMAEAIAARADAVSGAADGVADAMEYAGIGLPNYPAGTHGTDGTLWTDSQVGDYIARLGRCVAKHLRKRRVRGSGDSR